MFSISKKMIVIPILVTSSVLAPLMMTHREIEKEDMEISTIEQRIDELIELQKQSRSAPQLSLIHQTWDGIKELKDAYPNLEMTIASAPQTLELDSKVWWGEVRGVVSELVSLARYIDDDPNAQLYSFTQGGDGASMKFYVVGIEEEIK